MFRKNCLLLKNRHLLNWQLDRIWYMTEFRPTSRRVNSIWSSQCAMAAESAFMVVSLFQIRCWCVMTFIQIIADLRETQTDMLHKHLAKHPNHANANWHQRSVTGHVWHSDFVRRENKLKHALYRRGNGASDEQRKAYELLFGREGFRSQNICLVGVPASGKTWIAKKLSSLLQCVFFEKGEIIRCAPIGRVACSFHPEARLG